MMKRMEKWMSHLKFYLPNINDEISEFLNSTSDSVTTSAICDHTYWPQWLAQMLLRRCFSGFLTLVWLCVCVCVCVCVCACAGVSSYLHCEWATEQQLVKDKRIQQKIKRFKMKQAQRALFFADVRLCGCVFVRTHTVNCLHMYTQIWAFGVSRCVFSQFGVS